MPKVEFIFAARKVNRKVDFLGRKVDYKVHNFKGRICKLDFPARHESKFAAYFTGWQILRPEKSVKVVF